MWDILILTSRMHGVCSNAESRGIPTTGESAHRWAASGWALPWVATPLPCCRRPEQSFDSFEHSCCAKATSMLVHCSIAAVRMCACRRLLCPMLLQELQGSAGCATISQCRCYICACLAQARQPLHMRSAALFTFGNTWTHVQVAQSQHL